MKTDCNETTFMDEDGAQILTKHLPMGKFYICREKVGFIEFSCEVKRELVE